MSHNVPLRRRRPARGSSRSGSRHSLTQPALAPSGPPGVGAIGSGSGASPELPDEPIEATVKEPEKPQPDDVGKTGLKQ